MLTDEDVIASAREAATRYLEADPELVRHARACARPCGRDRGVRARRLPGQGMTLMTRIIGGSAGGRRLRTPTGDATRPTSDRVREALFSALEAQLGSLHGLRFLDLYAGSGAVGLEAMSRGAGVVTAVESDRRTAGWCGQRDRTRLRPSRCARSLVGGARDAPAAPYDVVFLDPPYPMARRGGRHALALLVAHGWVAPAALSWWSVLRVAWILRGPPASSSAGSKEYGETVLWYLRRDRPSSWTRSGRDDGPPAVT